MSDQPSTSNRRDGFETPDPGIQSGSGPSRPPGLTDAEWEQLQRDLLADSGFAGGIRPEPEPPVESTDA